LRFADRDFIGAAPERVCRHGIGPVSEDRRTFPGLTVKENSRPGLPQTPRRTRAKARASLEGIYERFSRLAERRRQMGTTLTGGVQQMLAMARVRAGSPKLLLIDEPPEGGGP
jgi:branched-chain amino acid transport system ATP-binding protein